jgi:hypothetical protein
VSIDLVVHAPNVQGLARAALPWLTDAQFADSASALIAAIRHDVTPRQPTTRLRILDVFGPNPDHPLQDPLLLGQLRALLAPRAAVIVTTLNIHPVQAANIGGSQFAGFGGATDQVASAGFSGFAGSGFAGLGQAAASSFGGGGFSGASAGLESLPYLAAAQAALGDRLRVRVVASLAQARQSWGM